MTTLKPGKVSFCVKMLLNAVNLNKLGAFEHVIATNSLIK